MWCHLDAKAKPAVELKLVSSSTGEAGCKARSGEHRTLLDCEAVSLRVLGGQLHGPVPSSLPGMRNRWLLLLSPAGP